MTRAEVLSRLVGMLTALDPPHVPRVAVDGPDAAGKTTFARDLAALIEVQRPVIALGADGFHRPAQVRYRRGRQSPEGYYLDSFDNESIVAAVLRPLGPGGDRCYLPSKFDYRSDRPVPAVRRAAASRAVLLFDGVFLQRPELVEHWDFTIYLHIEPAESLRRALTRDLVPFGSEASIGDRYNRRYLPGQELYRSAARPLDRADVLLDLTVPARPVPVRWPERRTTG